MRCLNPLPLLLLSCLACGDTSAPNDADTRDTSDTGDTSAGIDGDTADAEDSMDIEGPDAITWECQIPAATPDPEQTPYLEALGCEGDFTALASEPLDASIPAARSLKTVYDRVGKVLYFQNVDLYPIHYDFCRAHLSGQGLPIVPDLGTFNGTEYQSPSRRFLLGSVTYYAGPDAWVYELAPYDTASSAMITTAFEEIRAHAFFGKDLRFHPTSQAIEAVAANLPASIPRITTSELFAGITYQPLNLATSMGRLRFVRAADLDRTALDYRDIVVLDFVPNDIAVVQGLITEQLQTPLAHVNVLSQNRGTPNMALRGAWSDATLRGLEGRWVELHVGAFTWSIREVTTTEADAWWEAHRPPPLGIPNRDLSVTEIREIADVLPTVPVSSTPFGDLGPALDAAIPAFGGKASHYAALGKVSGVRVYRALAIPLSHYAKHLADHGLDQAIDAMLADPSFKADPLVRRQRLAELQTAIIAAPIDPALLAEVTARVKTLPKSRVRFRSSTNAEDLDGFTGAGLYTSETGDPNDPDAPIDIAMKTVWASVWRFKAFDEREYRGIDHTAVGMALLVTPSFPDEEANGVAITGNLFDPSGMEPGFVINVQRGDTSVVLPPPGVSSDYFIYFFDYPGSPVTFLTHSNLVAAGQTVLTRSQLFELGQALTKVHTYFAATYQRTGHFYGMDVEFKLDAPVGAEPRVWLKQARPHPGWGLVPP